MATDWPDIVRSFVEVDVTVEDCTGVGLTLAGMVVRDTVGSGRELENCDGFTGTPVEFVDGGKLWVVIGRDIVVEEDGGSASLVLGLWLSVPLISVNDLTKDVLVLEIEALAPVDAFIAPALGGPGDNRDVVDWERTVLIEDPLTDKEARTEVVVAAPGPSPKAGTLPICLEEVRPALFLCEVKITDVSIDDGSPAADEDVEEDEEAIVGTDCLVCVVKVLESLVAAPGPSPNAGTLPICFDTIPEAVEVGATWTGSVDLVDGEEIIDVGGCDVVIEIDD